MINIDCNKELFQACIRYTIPHRFELSLELKSNVPITALYGPSGSGKSTVLKLISGWIPSKSQVLLSGRNVSIGSHGKPEPISQRPIGMVFQEDLLFPHLNVLANIEFSRRFGHRAKIDDQKMQWLVDSFGIGHLLGRNVENLSGGERQRVGLVRALAAGPRLLLCDEPVSAIDRAGRGELLSHLKAWVERENAVMILVTHDVDEIRQLAGLVWKLDAGELIQEGAPDTLFS